MADEPKVGVGAKDATVVTTSGKSPLVESAEQAVAKAKQQLEWAERALAQARKEK